MIGSNGHFRPFTRVCARPCHPRLAHHGEGRGDVTTLDGENLPLSENVDP